MKINRRDLLAVSAAGLAGAAGFGLGGTRPAFAQEPSLHAGGRRQPSPAALVALRAGR